MFASEVFQRFVEDSPVCVMVQTLLENTLPPTTGSRHEPWLEGYRVKVLDGSPRP